MNADQHDLDDTIRDAVAEFGDAIDASIPDFGAILSGRQRHTRRLLASATAAIAVIGVVGVVLAGNRAQAPGNATSAGIDESTTTTIVDPIDESTTTTTVELTGDTTTTSLLSPPTTGAAPVTTPTEYFCTDPIGEDRLGRALFGSCEPAPSQIDSDYACTDPIGTDGTGRQRFSMCEAVGQLGPIPGDDDDEPFDNPDDIPVRATTYVVQPGDYAIAVAAEFCVSVGDLEDANGWADASRDFPGPGNEILIPSTVDEARCASGRGSYTITADDTTRIAVANRFCISVQALDTANLETEGYAGFFPGLVIVIPPSSDDTC